MLLDDFWLYNELKAGKKDIFIPYGTTIIPEYVISPTHKDIVTSITLPCSILTIEQNAFAECLELTSVKISPDTIVTEEEWTTPPLAQIPTDKAFATSIGLHAFYRCTKLASFTIPFGITIIGVDAFFECDKLTSVNMPISITTIESGAFFGCEALSSISIPPGVITIGELAFFGCEALTYVFIPSSVISIEENAFGECPKLLTISIPATLDISTLGLSPNVNIIRRSIDIIARLAPKHNSILDNAYIGKFKPPIANGITLFLRLVINKCILIPRVPLELMDIICSFLCVSLNDSKKSSRESQEIIHKWSQVALSLDNEIQSFYAKKLQSLKTKHLDLPTQSP